MKYQSLALLVFRKYGIKLMFCVKGNIINAYNFGSELSLYLSFGENINVLQI